MIWDRRSGSRVAAEWFAADGGTLTGVDDMVVDVCMGGGRGWVEVFSCVAALA